MKFTVSMKSPDALDDAIKEAVKQYNMGGMEEEIETLREMREEKIKKFCHAWFQYGEYLRVEIDTKANTCTVLSAN